MSAASPSELDETGLPEEGCDDEDMAATWFQDDLPEDVEAAPGEDELHAQLCASVRGLLYCDNDADHVARQVRTLKVASAAVAPIETLAAALSKLYPCRRVYMREAKGSPLKSMCLTRLRHKCIVVSRPQAPSSSPRSPLHIPDEPLIVEVALKDALDIADPTPRYQALLDLLPDVYVATDTNFMATLQLVADEMKASFAEKQKEMPPWRTYPALSSKWSPHTSEDTPVPPPKDPAACRPPAAAAASSPECGVRQPPAPAHVPGNPTPTTNITIARRPAPRGPPPPTPYPFQPPCMVPGKQPAKPIAPLCTTTSTTPAAPTTDATPLASTPPSKSSPRAPPQPTALATKPLPPATTRPSHPTILHQAPTPVPSRAAPFKPPAPRSALQAFFPLSPPQPPPPGRPCPHLLVGATANPKLTSSLTASLHAASATAAPAPAACKASKGAMQSTHRSSAAEAAGPATPPPVGHGSTATAGSPGYFFLAEIMET